VLLEGLVRGRAGQILQRGWGQPQLRRSGTKDTQCAKREYRNTLYIVRWYSDKHTNRRIQCLSVVFRKPPSLTRETKTKNARTTGDAKRTLEKVWDVFLLFLAPAGLWQ
jgi:hypothetical protein